MRLSNLYIDGLRNLSDQQLALDSSLNLVVGANGAGKTSILEAIHHLSTGRSFRPSSKHDLIQKGRKFALIRANVVEDGKKTTVGQQRSSTGSEIRLNGSNAKQREVSILLPIRVFATDSLEWVTGSSEVRRKLIDWGVFHVEHLFFQEWKRYHRALSHLYAMAKKKPNLQTLAPWIKTLEDSADRITHSRKLYLEAFSVCVTQRLKTLDSQLAHLRFNFSQGWPRDSSLSDAITENLKHLSERGFLSVGAHRADFRIQDEHGLVAKRLSRGQIKTVAIAILLAQTDCFAQVHQYRPLLGLDDIGAELDKDHIQYVMQELQENEQQAIVTALTENDVPNEHRQKLKMFHVEQGQVREA